jgi:cytochrome c-type biogenesis protein CcmH
MRKLVWLTTLWLGIAGGLFAAVSQEGFDDPALDTRYRALIREIRCPKCLNESIADSNAPLAADMRREIQRLIGEGASDDEVKEFLASRYGEAVLYNPRLSPATAVLWAAPFVLLGLGAFVFWRILAARGNQPLDEEPPP